MKRFAPGWTMTLLVAIVLPVLISLGVWQLRRADEKLAYQARYLEQVEAAPRAPESTSTGGDFRRVLLEGRYLPGQHYLVDNRVRQGRPGYWVVTRFAAEDGRIYLINRGWIAAPASRRQLPEVPETGGPVMLVGVAWPDMGLPPLLAPDPWPQGWPKRVQRLNVRRMSDDSRVVPVEIRLEPDQPGVLSAPPLEVDFRPERHQGYAVQWFALALVLAAGYVAFAFKRGQEKSNE